MARRLFVVSEDLECTPLTMCFWACAAEAGLGHGDAPGLQDIGITRRKVSSMNSEPCFYKNLIVVHKLSVHELLRMWNVVHSEGLVCARKVSI
ncbi:hypothetical protein KUCAC02_012757 [Chaenocephalus aceratus]|uniref:Uncharacterized protein n=1 Tax=Chaenocephalus aceratus TaxID=36190 RepID=A0ACB9XDF1_CHAAC|nr:hypothetical protein KUCAC02_012757 [Chaenocephalus aceratus]